jgi:phosphoglycolate phosphatase-like HAD superfamily hydrolase
MNILVCDLDGTLIDVRQRDYSAYGHAVGQIGEQPIAEDPFWAARREGRRIVEFVSEHVPEERDAVLNAFVEVVESDELLALDPLFDDTLSFLTSVRTSGWQIVVCTLRHRPEAAKRQLDRLGLRPLVDEVCVLPQGEECPKAATLMGYAPARTIMVGDTESDIASARRAGVPVYAVTTGLRGRAFLEKHAPAVIADSLTELLPLLKGADE